MVLYYNIEDTRTLKLTESNFMILADVLVGPCNSYSKMELVYRIFSSRYMFVRIHLNYELDFPFHAWSYSVYDI